MKIKRNCGGAIGELTIDLTAEELRAAYYEQEHLFDVEDVRIFLNDMDDEDFADYGVSRLEMLEHIDDVAGRKRHYIDKYDMGWEAATEEAVRFCLGRPIWRYVR